jgi:hypothetical protein
MQEISIINISRTLSDDEISAALPNLQAQVSQHFAPAWAADATLVQEPRNSMPSPDSWWLVILDDSDQADALGYHDMTPSYMPLGKVFARTDRESGHTWTVTASHELLEMLADPWLNRVAPDLRDPNNPVFYAYEICDACQVDQLGYRINDTLVSNFVYPKWFEPNRNVSGPFDFLKLIERPLQVLPGGYIGIFEPRLGWRQYNGTASTKQFASDPSVSRQLTVRVGSRRDRRLRKYLGFDLQTSKPGKGENRRPGTIADIVSGMCLALIEPN